MKTSFFRNKLSAQHLLALGAVRGEFHCAARVAITQSEKQALRETTKADAVEMESAVIRRICFEKQIPSATIRVISDPADEDLPLDFNALMTSDYRINYLRLIGTLLRSPSIIPALIKFQRQTISGARSLGRVLEELFRAKFD